MPEIQTRELYPEPGGLKIPLFRIVILSFERIVNEEWAAQIEVCSPEKPISALRVK